MTDVALPEITYRLDTTALTVIAIDQYNQETDLNATGEPCRTLGHLREFVEQLIGQGLEIPDLLVEIEAVISETETDDEQTLKRAVRTASAALSRFAPACGLGEQASWAAALAVEERRDEIALEMEREDREPVDLDPLRSVEVQDEVDRQDRHYGLRHMDDHTLEITTEAGFESLGFARSRYLAHTESVEADLAAAGKRAVELENGPLAKELAAEKAAEDAVCPECHGRSSRSWGPCPRCKGSGRIDPSDFGIPTTQVARGRNAS